MATLTDIRHSLLRARDTFEQRPSSALHDDSVAVAMWKGGLATDLMHPTLAGLRTDMPSVLGGEEGGPSPGWFFRAGLASCMATSIAMEASLRGIVLTRLEVHAHSETDARGMLGAAGVPAGALRFWLDIVLEAQDAPDAALRELVSAADAHSPMSSAIRRPVDVAIGLRLPAGGAE